MGAGLGCFTVSFLVSLYYNTVLVWVLWYFLNSFQQPLPWGTCPPNLNRTGEAHGGWGQEESLRPLWPGSSKSEGAGGGQGYADSQPTATGAAPWQGWWRSARAVAR